MCPQKKKRLTVSTSSSNIHQSNNQNATISFNISSTNIRNIPTLSYNGINKNEQIDSSITPTRGVYFSTSSLQTNGQENFSISGQNTQQRAQFRRFTNSSNLNSNTYQANFRGLFSSTIVNTAQLPHLASN